MDYYVGNAVYNYLRQSEMKKKFFWMSADKWILVYGDEHLEPKVVSVVTQGDISEDLTESEKNALTVVKNIVKNTDVGMNFIKYNPKEALKEVRYWESGETETTIINMEQLKNKFSAYGLKMNSVSASKGINDRSSSSYHEWQRYNMGSSITVVDIDLIRFIDSKVGEIIELKRSKDAIEEWEPYEDDYNNYILISKLAVKANIDFYILYNYRRKNPFLDDISRLKLFKCDHRKDPYYRLLGYGEIKGFAEGGKSIDMIPRNDGDAI